MIDPNTAVISFYISYMQNGQEVRESFLNQNGSVYLRTDFIINELYDLNIDSEEIRFEVLFGDENTRNVWIQLKEPLRIKINNKVYEINTPDSIETNIYYYQTNPIQLSDMGLSIGNGNLIEIDVNDGALGLADFYLNISLTGYDRSTEEEEGDEEEETDKHGDAEPEEGNPVDKAILKEQGKKAETEQKAKELEETLKNQDSNITVAKLKRSGKILEVNIPHGFLEPTAKKLNQSKAGLKLLEIFKTNGYKVTSFKKGKKENLNIKEKGTPTEIVLERVNVETSFKQKRINDSIEALYAYNRVASILLTEPYFYLEDPKDIILEKRRIKKLFGKKIVPCFYQTLESFACGNSHLQVMLSENKEELKEAYKSTIQGKIDNNLTEAMRKREREILKYGAATLIIGVGAVLLAPVVLAMGAAGASTLGLTSVAAGLTTAGTTAGTAAGTTIAISAALDAGFTAQEIYNSNKDIETNNKRVKKGLFCLSTFLKENYTQYTAKDIIDIIKLSGVSYISDIDEESKRREVASKTLKRAVGRTGTGGEEINGAINLMTGKFLASTPSFKQFEDLVYRIGASSALNAILKPENLKTTKNDYDYPTNLYAEEVIGSEAQEYLYFLLQFPWYEYQAEFWSASSWWAFDTKGAHDIFRTNENTGAVLFQKNTHSDISPNDAKSLTYNESKNDFLKKETMFNLQCQNLKKDKNGEYETVAHNGTARQNAIGKKIYKAILKGKEKRKAQQEKKINFLLTLRDALVQEVIAANAEAFYEDGRFKEYVMSFNAGSIFKIMDSSAYPDIDLPEKFISGKRIPLLNPDFYYFKSFPQNEKRRDLKAIDKIIKNSVAFKEDIREKIVTNRPLELGGSKPIELTDRSTITNISGSSFNIVGRQKMGFVSNLKNENLETMKVNNIPVSASRFKTAEDLKNYITSKQTEITNKETELKDLKSLIGKKNFSEVVKEEDVNKLIKDAKGKYHEDNIKALTSVFSISEVNEYNDTESLKNLALESNEAEMLNLGMLKAFPTFRFYIVEEDSIYSDKLTAYDDFYSYASVISFNVNTSRELPAATAQIVLQNVSGVLDGSKKEVYRDIDVDSRKILSGDDDQFKDSIESIVLRPGVNAQLRAGYNAVCSELDILISGRITEIQYGNDGMTTNITLQSHGVELDQKIEGNLARNNKDNKFYSTHQLLGTLMLSTQLKHFGRIKTGKIFQSLENKSAALDNRMPNNASGFNFYFTNRFTQYLGDNAGTIVTSLIVMGIAKRIAGPLARRFDFTQGLKVYTQRTAAQLWRAGGQALGSRKVVDALVKKPFQAFLGTSKWMVNNKLISPGWIGRSSTNMIRDNKVLVQALLDRIKSGAVKGLRDLSFQERRLYRKIIQSLGKDTLVELRRALPAGAGRGAANIESKIIAQAIREEGMGFALSGFGTQALLGSTRALSAIKDAAVKGTSLIGDRWFETLGNVGLAGTVGVGRGIVHTMAVGIGVGGTVGLLGLWADSIYNGADFAIELKDDLWESFFGEDEDDTLRILLSPQDDNLFLPDSKSYLRDEKKDTSWFGQSLNNAKLPVLNVARFGTGMLSTASFGLSEILGISVAGEIEKRFKEFKGLFDTRLRVDENENIFHLKGQTIFDVFHEMTLRHPGYIYGARPYGDSMEYRMFFGLPSQRYWAEDISTVDALRLNKFLKEYAKTSKDDWALSSNYCAAYYPVQYARIKKELMKVQFGQSKESKDYIARAEITSFALSEFLNKTKKRFVPFRKMHLLNSERNIVSNNIIVSGHDVINTVSVNYTKLDSNGSQLMATDDGYRSTYAINLSSNTAIPPGMQKPKTFSSDNIVGPSAAYRYGIGQLLYGGREMYQGSVLTLGNPKINPWDVLIINDEVNRMYGPVEVRAVNHMFNHEVGFLTDIEVNALVTFGEDTLTYPNIVASILGQAKEQIFNEFSSRAQFENTLSSKEGKDYYEEILKNLIDEDLSSGSEDLRNSLKNVLIDKLKEEMEISKKENRPFFLRDVLDNDISLPEDVQKEFENLMKIGGESAAYYGGIRGVFTSWNYFIRGVKPISNTTGKLKLPLGRGFVGTLAALGAGYFFSESIVNNVESSLNAGRLGKNLFRPVLMSKVSNQSLIEVYPLVKDGKPLLAGGFEGVPASQSYQNILGNIYSDVSDGIKGFIKNRHKIEKKGAGSIYEFDEDFIVRTPSAYSVASSEGGLITTEVIRRYFKED